MPLFARPFFDMSISGWRRSVAEDFWFDLYKSLNESVADDVDHIQSITSPDNRWAVFKFLGIEDPSTSSSHKVICRYRKSGNEAGDTIDLSVQLRQGYSFEGFPGTLIDEVILTDIDGSGWIQLTMELSPAEADSITNYNDLHVRFHANTSGSTGGTAHMALVSYVVFQVGDTSVPLKSANMEGGLQLLNGRRV